MSLPQDVSPDVLEILGRITAAQNAMTKASEWLDVARQDRDHEISMLRRAGWTIDQVATYTGLSVAGIYKIGKRQGLVSYRGVTTREEAS